ncbi:DeoR/GlpR family DNA-binding transcription regulator [Heyndrickxia ginsengihumi]|uniref:DeoR faimly transcriptional regulator n=1 Tax=Heyndrickxia ginsengihumi TaxID=363870 RepID=A0A0A6Y135_9BACI|nr:DeoR/GlpR family DNA-binding transcription regulator [Heyndrickxia ginsengihumi]KHD86002.1 DeoR faimly transcriptional regulator [Heyndrickxia ginsengihumi]MBE6182949.1 DeoR/GlpR transcriptional regulator [Bacillus sp. (in: firmicutes)]NEY20095.1 DeoR/GlpR transcriptional regulator [Heyndrickxia ginsengihumi]
MLTEQRHRMILELLKSKNIVSIQEFTAYTNSSESTIRRDLTQLEKKKLLKRIHGGAQRLHGKLQEPNIVEKTAQNTRVKEKIGLYAASLVEKDDCIYLDAGSTTMQMIQYLNPGNHMVVVTNGITLIPHLLAKGIKTYLIGGLVKPRTEAVIGSGALNDINGYRFDKCFLGTNGIHPKLGCTTPDPEEAILKSKALELSQEGFILADDSKFGEISFSKFAELSDVTIITNELEQEILSIYQEKTEIKVV